MISTRKLSKKVKSNFTPYRIIGDPSKFDLPFEEDRFKFGKVVVEKRGGSLQCHYYDHSPWKFESDNAKAFGFFRQIKRADDSLNFPDFDPVKIYFIDVPPTAKIINESTEPILFQSYIDKEEPECPPNLKLHPDFICCPDFTFWDWCGMKYEKYFSKIRAAGEVEPRSKKMFWRGMKYPKLRGPLVDLSSQYPDLIDAKFSKPNKNDSDFMSLEDAVLGYSYFIDLQASGWSPRVKYFLQSHRLTFLQERFHKAYYEEYLVPMEHYIPIKKDLSDLIDKINWANKNPKEVKRISDNAFNFSLEHLSISSVNKKWEEVINASRYE
tara:strand:+ start:2487 stop:3461 length:975 start_codon:yes stop_codon:yes gene_type:complete